MLPPAAQDYHRAQTKEHRAALHAVKRQWGRMGSDFDSSWATIAMVVAAIMVTAQERTVEQAVAYIPQVLEDTGQARSIDSTADINPGAFVGVNGDGRMIEEALFGAVIVAKARVGQGTGVGQALHAGGQWLTQAAGTALSDTGRAVERVGMAVRPIGGYVRMLTPPSCSRCVILAGARYYSSTAFQRHPRCDCRHIPASESVAGDLTVSPSEYFDSLPKDEQDRIFTRAGAEAIRNGADINQVVNARSGMYTTKDGFKFTRAGTTRRGLYGSRERRRGSNRRRLMPEQIQAIASSKDEYLRLLKAYGYVI